MLETAIAIPVLIVVGAILMWAIGLGVTSLNLAAHARDIARAVARGESTEIAVDRIMRRDSKARVVIREADNSVIVSVREVVTIPFPLFDGLDLTLTHDSVAPREAPIGMEAAGASD